MSRFEAVLTAIGVWLIACTASYAGAPPQNTALAASPPSVWPYAQQAIFFNHLTNLTRQGSAFPGLSDSPVGTVSFWYRCNPTVGSPNQCKAFPLIGNLNATTQGAEQVSGLDIVTDNQSNQLGTMRVNLNDATGGNVAAHTCLAMNPSGQPVNVWTHWLISWNLTSSNNLAIYRNGVSVTTGCNVTNYTGSYPLNVNLSNAAGFSIFGASNWVGTNKINSGSPGEGGLADLFMDFTKSVLLPGTNIIPSQTVKKFIKNGAPANLGANCSLPLGYRPQFCFQGNKTTWATNLGSLGGGGATLNGNVWNESTSASTLKPAHTVVSNWATTFVSSNTCSGTYPVQACSGVVTTGGNTINVGDELILTLVIADSNRTFVSGNGCATPGHCAACPDGTWTTSYDNWNNGGSGNGIATELLVCTKIAAAGDAGTAATYTDTYTTQAQRGIQMTLLDYTGVDTSTPIEAVLGLPASGSNAGSSGTNFTASTSIVAPSITPSSPNDTEVMIFVPPQTGLTLTYPTDADARIRSSTTSTGGAETVVLDKVLASSAATATETLTQSASTGSAAVAIALKPN